MGHMENLSQGRTLIVHARIHTGDKPHSCDAYGKPFTSKDDLIECMLIHTGDGPHSCKICGKSYSLKGYLIRHKHIHHNSDTCWEIVNTMSISNNTNSY